MLLGMPSLLVGMVILLLPLPGSIAEAAYGIPDWIKDKAYTYLDDPLKDVLSRWEQEVSIT